MAPQTRSNINGRKLFLLKNTCRRYTRLRLRTYHGKVFHLESISQEYCYMGAITAAVVKTLVFFFWNLLRSKLTFFCCFEWCHYRLSHTFVATPSRCLLGSLMTPRLEFIDFETKRGAWRNGACCFESSLLDCLVGTTWLYSRVSSINMHSCWSSTMNPN